MNVAACGTEKVYSLFPVERMKHTIVEPPDYSGRRQRNISSNSPSPSERSATST